MKIGRITIVHPRPWNPMYWYCRLANLWVSVPWWGIVYCTEESFEEVMADTVYAQALLVHETVHILQFGMDRGLWWVLGYFTSLQRRRQRESEAYGAHLMVCQNAGRDTAELEAWIKQTLNSWKYLWCGYDPDLLYRKIPTALTMQAVHSLDGTVYEIDVGGKS